MLYAFLLFAFKNVYFQPITPSNKEKLLIAFSEFCASAQTCQTLHIPTHRSAELNVYGHKLQVPWLAAGRRCAKFSLDELCGQAYGAADFIDLGKALHVIALTDIHKFQITSRNEVGALNISPYLSLVVCNNHLLEQLRRFITLVDALYESKTLVLFLADAQPTEMLALDEESKRTSTFDEVRTR